MLKKHMAACLVATAFAAAPAIAQTSTTPSAPTDRPAATGSGSATSGSPAMQPGATTGTTMAPGAAGSSTTGSSATGSSTMGSSTMGSTSGTSSTMAQSGGMQGQFMTQMQPNQMMASKLIGTNVISANNESIGDVNDVILDRDGQVMAVVVGVGGFLGIGEKDVAVPLKSLEFATREQVNAMNSNANSGSTASGTTSTMSNNAVNTTGSTTGSTTGGAATNRSTATTGNTGNSGTSSAANSGSNANEPERVVLRMTKAELQAAPTFQTSTRNGNNAGSTGSSTTGTTTAPKQ